MQAYKLKTFIPPDHSITLRIPAEIPSGDVEIVLLVPEHNGSPALAPAADMQKFLAQVERISAISSSGRSKEDIDRSIAEERQAWE